MSTQKRTRCKNGTRKNKKTGNCDSVLDNTCSICLDRITSHNVTTKCKHRFHKQCLVGWCKGNKDQPSCPICRKNIKDTCKKIMPFDSHEVFRYTDIGNESKESRLYKMARIEEIIQDKNFDVNVKNTFGKSLLYILSWNRYRNPYFKDYVEYLLKQPNIEVSADLISELIGTGNTEMLQLYKKYKKIPKSLKSLV